MTDDRVGKLIDEATRLRWSRRQVLKRAAVLGLSAPAISLVLAACGDDDDDDDGADPTATQAASTGGTTTTSSPAAATTVSEATEPADAATEPPTEGTATSPAGAAETPMPTEGSGGIINIPNTDGDNGIGNPILNSNSTNV